MKKTYNCSKTRFLFYLAFLTFSVPISSFGQYNQCDSIVPYFEVDFTGDPAGVWESPLHSRDGLCCSATGSSTCTSFKVTLDTQAVAIKVEITEGAMPSGALYYQINCGPEVMIGEEICISGMGPHFITFCKPGTNANKYKISSISVPTFPPDDYARTICNKEIKTSGLDTSTITINSIFPGASGDYNHYLSCTTSCSSIYFSPDSLAPEYIDYTICGYPIADKCGYTQTLCDTFRIYIYPELSATVSPENAIICSGDPGVLISSQATGGDGNYSYTWSDSSGNIVSTSADYFATTSGSYTLELKDGLSQDSCNSFLFTVPVTVLPRVNAEIVNIQNVLCKGAGSGSATVNAFDGSGNYSYSWNTTPVQNTATATDLSAGTYEVTVSDYNGCTDPAILSVTITEPENQLEASILSPQDILCNGNSTGTATVEATGGSGSYLYQWNTSPIQNTATATDLSAGTYEVVVSDSNGCDNEILLTVTIVEPENLYVVASIESAICNENNGSISLNVNGGTAPYSYSWSNGSNESEITDLTSGLYNVTVVDSNECEQQLMISLDEISAMQVNTESKNVSCYGLENGYASVDVNLGASPYRYKWSTGNTTSYLSDIKAGIYYVTITDKDNCITSKQITIEQPDTLIVDITPYLFTNTYNVSSFDGNDGSIKVDIKGGVNPYSYQWSTGDITADLNNLKAGTYAVYITDANGCKATSSTVLSQPMMLEMPTGFSPDNSGKNDRFVIRGIEEFSNNKFTVFNRWGNEVYSRENYMNEWNGTNNEGKVLPAGTYFVLLMIENEDKILKGFVDLRK